jgi:iron(III) transport system permease protein
LSQKVERYGPEWERRHTAALAVPVLVLLVWLVLYPNTLVVFESVLDAGRLTFAHYAEFFSTRAELEALWASVWISLASVLLSGLIGVPLALFFHRFEFPGRRLFGALAALPVLLPPLVGVIAFLFLAGESGILTRGVQRLLDLQVPPWRLAGAPAILFVHAYTMYVYFYLFTLAGLTRIDAGVGEAAASLGAGRWRTFRRVTLPLLTPSLTAAALLVFMTSMASFSAPYVFGGGFRVLTTQIYTSKVSGALSMAMVETVMLAAASLAVLWLLRRYEEGREYVAVGKGVAAARGTVRSPVMRLLLTLAGAGWVLLLLLPHLTLVLVSFVPDGAWTTQLLPERYSLENYAGLLRDPELFGPILSSIQMATLATAANLIFCFVAAYLIVRRRFRGRAWLAVLVVLPWALPGTVIAIGLSTTGDLLDSAARLLHPEHPAGCPGRDLGLPSFRSQPGGGGRIARRRLGSDYAARGAAARPAGAGGRRSARVRDRAGRVRRLDPSLHASLPADLDRDPRSAARLRLRRSGGARSDTGFAHGPGVRARGPLRERGGVAQEEEGGSMTGPKRPKGGRDAVEHESGGLHVRHHVGRATATRLARRHDVARVRR